ncbi:hypothetical protein LP52_06115 [Streptomonospora alba]|uniref:Uncharacterized protein n=1 Tax=Streptomonospora alba TaxID=183763 RepID=A0A0C2JEJ9_9ACTN|nr:hypothetical protein [Streptomonospora alba]KIH99771.1 hypothetical protein LP52_06115 [Streptomonospora alba]
MSDPYSIDPSSGPAPANTSAATPQQRSANSARTVQVLLWTLFAVCLAVNAVGSLVAMPLLLDAAFGAGALACLVAAIVHYRRTRR